MDIAPRIYRSEKEVPDGATRIEAFDSAIYELFFISNPSYKKGMPEVEIKFKEFLSTLNIGPIWVYYPKNQIVVRTVPEEFYYKLRTSRNREIINTEEQLKYRDAKVGVMGLSVGSSVINALVASGGPRQIKIADFDEVEITNLNRIKASLYDVGKNKTHIAAEYIYGLDPFANLELWDKGVNKNNIEDFIVGPSPVGILIDEMDSIDLKVKARYICQKFKIPVLMATDNGDSIILDVERFDEEPQRPIFHNLLGDFQAEDLDFKQWLQVATKIVGAEFLTERMQVSLLEIGRTIPAVPQLGPTASIAGAAIAFCVRRIANKQSLPSGRYILGLEEKLVPGYATDEAKGQREKKTKEFIDSFKTRI